MLDVEKSIEVIKHKGFPYFKIELEANVEYLRGCDSRDSGAPCPTCQGKGTSVTYCTSCDGTGSFACEHCKREGKVYKANGEVIDCPYCEGRGYSEICHYCHGEGKVVKTCQNCHGRGTYDSGENGQDQIRAIASNFLGRLGKRLCNRIVYQRCYHDGANNVEITLTLPIEDIGFMKDIVAAFGKACGRFGSVHTSNAGMHVALLPSAAYPPNVRLPFFKVQKFKSAMNRLMLAMTLAACDGERTRNFVWRDLRASSHEKFSAIYTVGNKILEFRIFDTIYHKPERADLFVVMIASAMKYYDEEAELPKLPVLNLTGRTRMLNKGFERGRYTPIATLFRNGSLVERARKEIKELFGVEVQLSGSIEDKATQLANFNEVVNETENICPELLQEAF